MELRCGFMNLCQGPSLRNLCQWGFVGVLRKVSYLTVSRFSYLNVFVSLLKGLLRVRVRVRKLAL